MKNIKAIMASGLLMSCGPHVAHASVIGAGSVLWNFESELSQIYTPANPLGGLNSVYRSETGIESESQLVFYDSDWNAFGELNDSLLTATRDPASSDSRFAFSLDRSSAQNAVSVYGSFSTIFRTTTDVVDFSYFYDFFGVKGKDNDGLAFNVQVKILAGGTTYYSDYEGDPLPLTFFESYEGGPPEIDQQGSANFRYGDEGVFRFWTIITAVNFYGEDSWAVDVAEPTTLTLLGLGLVGMGLRRRKVA